jgi:hypothetical protein
MNPINQPTEQSQIVPTKSLIYWRKSPVNGAKCVPSILKLDENGLLTLEDDKAQAFSVPLSEVTASFSSWGTMTLNVGGRKYDFVGTPAPLSPTPSSKLTNQVDPTQQQVANGNQTVSTAGGALTAGGAGAAVAGSAAGAVGVVAGNVMMQYAYYKGLDAIKRWESTFMSAGLVKKKRSMRTLMYVTIAVAFIFIGLPLLIALITALFNR